MNDEPPIETAGLKLYRSGDEVIAIIDGNVGVGEDIPAAVLDAMKKKMPELQKMKLSPGVAWKLPRVEDLPEWPDEWFRES